MARVMALDLGDRRIGVAVSDPSLTVAQPLLVLHWGAGSRELPDRASVLERIRELCREYEVSELVVGFPRHMNGTVGRKASGALSWQRSLQEKLSIAVILEDERLTTALAEREMIQQNASRKRRREKVDKLAASLILKSYLARRRNVGDDDQRSQS